MPKNSHLPTARVNVAVAQPDTVADSQASSSTHSPAAAAVPAGETQIPNSRAEFLTLFGLPNSTTDAELNVILEANGGAAVPLQKSVFPALLAFTMREGAIPEREARKQLASKFPSLTPPAGNGPAAAGVAGSLRDQLLALYKLPADATDADIALAAETVQAENIADKARRSQEAADEVVIKKKTDAGLTRDQARAVIERQRHHDEFVSREQAGRRPRLVEIIKLFPGDRRAARHLVREEFPFLDSGEFNALFTELSKAAPTA